MIDIWSAALISQLDPQQLPAFQASSKRDFVRLAIGLAGMLILWAIALTCSYLG